MADRQMTLYTNTGEKNNYGIDNFIGGGAYGDVYKLDDDTCIKIIDDTFTFDDEAIKIIKDLKLDNFYEIYDLLYNSNGKRFRGYTMKYYQKEEIDILTMPTSYTLDNLYKLHRSFEKLGDKLVKVSDCYYANVIKNNDGLTVIDADLFHKYDEGRENSVRAKNYIELMYLFKDLYHEELRKLDYPIEDRDYILDNLFSTKEEVTGVEKKLVKYKYPIDYVKDAYKGGY